MTQRGTARKMAAEAIAAGEPLVWFERLYTQAQGDASMIPWADLTVNPNLQQWLEGGIDDRWSDLRAPVVGCGLGDDAEASAALGMKVVAFDVSPTSIDWCRKRFPDSFVDYHVADLFTLPSNWQLAFDFVVEVYTLQALPNGLRQQAMRKIAQTVAPDGTLLLISRGRDESDSVGEMPWPLLQAELDVFASSGLEEVNFEDFVDNETPPVRRFRVEYRRN